MSEEERNCRRCGVPIAPDGLCDFCAMDNLKASNRLEDKGTRMPVQVRDILTGPPSADELASAATVCERLAVHIESKGKDWLHRPKHLRDTIMILKGFLAVFLILLGCSNDVSDDDPDSELSTGYARTEERDAPIDAVDANVDANDFASTEENSVKPEENGDVVDDVDASDAVDANNTNFVEPEDDAAIDEPEEPDAAIDEPEEPDAHTDPSCAFSGTWYVRIVQGTLCISQNDPFVLEIAGCDRTDFERPLDLSDPMFGDFVGTITYHVDFEGQDSLTGTADIVGTIDINGQSLDCSSVATISGGRDETRNPS